jgi:predicted nucleic acid-binding protein
VSLSASEFEPHGLIAEDLNISAYDAGYVAVAKGKGLPLWSRDRAVAVKAPRVAVKVLP